MDTQNTPLHITLWHKEFWYLAFAELFMAMGLYLYIPFTDTHYVPCNKYPVCTLLLLPIVIAAMMIPGPFVYALMQRCGRKALCQRGLVLFVLVQAMLAFFHNILTDWMIVALVILMGMGYALAQMVLLSTLVIDKSESFQRTEANYIVSWFQRLAIALAPLIVILLGQNFHFYAVPMLSLGFSLLALAMITIVKIPFKAPEEVVCTVSTDRFFLTRSLPLAVNLALFIMAATMLLYGVWSEYFFLSLLAGFFLSIVAEKFAFANAELKSEAIAGGIMLLASAMIRLTRTDEPAILTSALLLGLGLGLLTSRFLLFFIKLCRHCERGTSQSSFFLCWEIGIVGGLIAGQLLQHPGHTAIASLLTAAVATAIYHLYMHKWYLRHKNR